MTYLNAILYLAIVLNVCGAGDGEGLHSQLGLSVAGRGINQHDRRQKLMDKAEYLDQMGLCFNCAKWARCVWFRLIGACSHWQRDPSYGREAWLEEVAE